MCGYFMHYSYSCRNKSATDTSSISALPGVYGSVGQPMASKPEVLGSTPGNSCFSLVFIEKLINDKSKHKKTKVTICFVLSGASHSYL